MGERAAVEPGPSGCWHWENVDLNVVAERIIQRGFSVMAGVATSPLDTVDFMTSMSLKFAVSRCCVRTAVQGTTGGPKKEAAGA